MAVPQSFPAKIYQILENESPEIISWNDNGISFRIVDHGRFEREIVPKYFRHNQISSVQRQLNLYGFKCISRGEFKRSFFHPKFRRGDWETVRKLTRYIPLKKNPDKPEESSSTPEPAAEGGNSTEERTAVPAPQQLLYPQYFFPLVPQNHTNSAQGPVQYLHGHAHSGGHLMVPHHQSMSMWQDGWNHYHHPDNGQFGPKNGSFVPQFAYGAMPAQQMAYQQQMQHHGASSAPMQMMHQPASAPAPSADNKQQSELSNRLGFKLPATEEQPASNPKSADNIGISSVGPHTPKHLVSVNQNNVVTVNPDYDFMVEFGMFDSLHLPELINSAMNAQQPAGMSSSAASTSSPSSTSSSTHASSSEGCAQPQPRVPAGEKEFIMTIPAVPVPMAVPVAAPRPSGKDVGCNTLLTFSKLHDALVVLHPEQQGEQK